MGVIIQRNAGRVWENLIRLQDKLHKLTGLQYKPKNVFVEVTL